MNVKILIYRFPPPFQSIRTDRVSCFEPLEMEYLYTALKEFDPCLLDGMRDRHDPVRYVKRKKINIVLLTGYLVHVPDMVKTAGRIKKIAGRKTFVFAGGPQAEVTPEIFDTADIDAIVTAGHPFVIRDVIRKIANDEDFAGAPGLSFFLGQKFRHNRIPDFDVQAWPLVERILFDKNPSNYFNMFFKPCASVKTAFGCPGKCSFCFCRKMNQSRFTQRPMLQIIAELQTVRAKNVFMLDDNFLCSKQRVREFIDEITKAGIHKNYIIYGTADFVAENKGLIVGLGRIGVKWIIIGFEYLDSAVLKEVGKKADSTDNEKAIAVCREAGIGITALFMVNPDWRAEDFRALEKYVVKHKLFFSTYSTATVFPGTSDWKNKPLTCRDKWFTYDLLRLHEKPVNMTRMEFYFRLYKLYMLPACNSETAKELIRYAGFLDAFRLIVYSSLTGLEFLVKLIFFP